MSVQVDDAEILSKFQDEKTRNEAFNLLLKKYQQKIYWHIRRMVIDHDDADDIAQDTFVKVWKNLSGFRNDAQLYTWMYRIATNECITFLNKKKAKKQYFAGWCRFWTGRYTLWIRPVYRWSNPA